jgi:hypothetical protein
MQMSQYASEQHWLEPCQLQELCQLSMTFGSWCSHSGKRGEAAKLAVEKDGLDPTFVSSSEDRPGDCLIKNLSCISNILR